MSEYLIHDKFHLIKKLLNHHKFNSETSPIFKVYLCLHMHAYSQIYTNIHPFTCIHVKILLFRFLWWIIRIFNFFIFLEFSLSFKCYFTVNCLGIRQSHYSELRIRRSK